MTVYAYSTHDNAERYNVVRPCAATREKKAATAR
jgi:hypothetical protein